eukprot:TRINITY_DN24342_c0_g1_i1.p6 TRINITY_DN24342_c0_g1~~TRINITY_DN24342_c0_g1_i1.p6  ORF type:complete len:137 (+),score=8.68 TRINITY_DN24342_c0_g1_i1:1403-1813(+)
MILWDRHTFTAEFRYLRKSARPDFFEYLRNESKWRSRFWVFVPYQCFHPVGGIRPVPSLARTGGYPVLNPWSGLAQGAQLRPQLAGSQRNDGCDRGDRLRHLPANKFSEGVRRPTDWSPGRDVNGCVFIYYDLWMN